MQSLNSQLVLSDSRYDILDYVKEVNKISTNPIDLDFMEELLKYVESDEPCIPHDLLVTYGVIKDNKDVSHLVKRLLEQFDLVECKDFKVDNVVDLGSNGKTYYKTNYILHPDAFKLCIMRSKNTRKYANYYILLERSIKYYHDYQTLYKDNLLKCKDDKIDTLQNKVDELLGYAKDSREDLSTLIEFSLEQAEKKEVSDIKMGKVVNKRITNCESSNNVEQLMLFKLSNELNTYYAIRGTLAYIKTKFRALTGVSYKDKDIITSKTNYIYLKMFSNVPNARHLYRALDSKFGIVTTGNKIVTNIGDIAVVNAIQTVFDLRLTIKLENKEVTIAKNRANNSVKAIKSKIVK
jgi:phage anti-repressor protein